MRIISKVLTNRLNPCLHSIISDKQSAFVEGRLLKDNAIIAYEVNHYIQRKTQGKYGVAGLKIDVSKAFDRVEWGFIENMLVKFGFQPLWINRIMACVTTVSYSFLHNGEVFGSITPQRGIRQGDPISPYLYILCAEGLTSIINRNESVGLIHGATKARGAPSITYLLFADDCYLFFRATDIEACTMKRILHKYENLSGKAIIYSKSNITFSPNTLRVDRGKVCSTLGVQELNAHYKYLGMPMFVGRNKNDTFGFLIDRVVQRLICDKIEKKLNGFWWGQGTQGKGIRWTSWHQLCSSKYGGGLGVRSLSLFDTAMLAKQGWRILTEENSLVTKLLKARYFPRTDFLNAEIGDIYVQNLMHSNTNTPDTDLLAKLFDDRDYQLIQRIPIPLNQKSDSWFWLHDSKSKFTVNTRCPRCFMHNESDLHTLFECDFAKTVWSMTTFHDQVRTNCTESCSAMLNRVFQTLNREQCAMFGMLCWSLWNRHNNWVWNRVNGSAFGIKSAAMSLLSEWRQACALEHKENLPMSVESSRWSKPHDNCVGVGAVIRDSEGKFVRARCNHIAGKWQPKEAEALSLKMALSWVQNLNYDHCIFQTDSKLLAEACKGIDGASYFHTIALDCVELYEHFNYILVQYVRSSANGVAHLLPTHSTSDLR
ncbi:uncharacterized protein LOC141683748 [Apium graveolens]|uniref:uncharacterized protein LOC141683748 n=1 Tax=Apium graveolens TaxID=4045 RepID=UPI003D7A92BF